MGYTQKYTTASGKTAYRYVNEPKVKVISIGGRTPTATTSGGRTNYSYNPQGDIVNPSKTVTPKNESTQERNQRYLNEINRAMRSSDPNELKDVQQMILNENPQAAATERKIQKEFAEGRVILKDPASSRVEQPKQTGDLKQYTATAQVYQRPIRDAPTFRTEQQTFDPSGRRISERSSIQAMPNKFIDNRTGNILPSGTVIKEKRTTYSYSDPIPTETKKISGTFSAREKGNWFEEWQRDLTITARSDSGKGWYEDFGGTLKTSAASTALVATQFGKTLVYDIPVGMFQMVTHPVQTTKDIWGAVTHPQETIQSVARYTQTDPELAVGTGLGILASGKVYGYGKKKFIDPAVSKTKTAILPNYKPIEQTGIEFRAAHTVESPVSNLYKLENQKVTSIHVTMGKLPDEFVTTAQPSSAGSFRSEFDLYHFYKSAPYQNKPQGYLGYAGILDDPASVPVEYVDTWTKPKIKALVFPDETVKKTPSGVKSQDIKTINIWQGQQSGATLIPAENIKGFSTETQLISPSRYVDDAGNALKGYENFQGSIVKRTGSSTYTYYVQDLKNPYQNIVAQKAWDIFGVKKEYSRIELIPSQTLPVTTAAEASKASNLARSGSSLAITPSYYTPKQYGTVSYAPSISSASLLTSSASAASIMSSGGSSSVLSPSRSPISSKTTSFSLDVSPVKSPYTERPSSASNVLSPSKSLITSPISSVGSGGSSGSRASVPRYPSYPSKASTPKYPSFPSAPSYPSKPSSPRYPSYPSFPSAPSYPRYPSYPSSPLIPSVPAIPSAPKAPKNKKSTRRSRTKYTSTPFNPDYFADLTSTTFKIKGKKPTKAQLATGLAARPILKSWRF